MPFSEAIEDRPITLANKIGPQGPILPERRFLGVLLTENACAFSAYSQLPTDKPDNPSDPPL